MLNEGTNLFSPTYSAWLEKPVVLLILFRQCQIPVPCRIVSETFAEVRLRIQAGLEIDVRKDLILALEVDALASDGRVN
jgi:hypothetical protein